MTDDVTVGAVRDAVGGRVRAARGRRGWTLDRLAAASGVSRRQVVDVEAGRSNPSLVTLLRLAAALEVSLVDLVADPPDQGTLVVRTAQDRLPLWQGPAGGSAVLASAADTPDLFELWDWTLGPGETYTSEPHRPGTRELLHVLSGRVRLTVDGRTADLPPGAAAAFAGDVPHGYANAGRGRARFSLAVLEPRVGVRP